MTLILVGHRILQLVTQIYWIELHFIGFDRKSDANRTVCAIAGCRESCSKVVDLLEMKMVFVPCESHVNTRLGTDHYQLSNN